MKEKREKGGNSDTVIQTAYVCVCVCAARLHVLKCVF